MTSTHLRCAVTVAHLGLAMAMASCVLEEHEADPDLDLITKCQRRPGCSSGQDAPPTIAVTTPAPNSAIAGITTIAGTASDDIALARVEVRLDEGAWTTAAGTTSWSTSFNLSGAVAGDHLITARALDAGGNVTATTVPVKIAGDAETGVVVWRADTSLPLEQEWASLGTATECAVITRTAQTSQRISRLTDASSPSPTGRLYRATVLGGDVCYGSRAELGQGNPVKTFTDGTGDRLFRAGADHWISFAHRLAPSYPVDDSRWSLIHQWKQTAAYGGPDGNPVLSMLAFRGRYRMWGPGYSELHGQNPPTGAYGSWGVDFAVAPTVGRWHLFTMHVVWSPDPAVGYVELLGDLGDGQGWRTLITGRHVATMKINDSGGAGETIPTHARIGNYRDDTYTVSTAVDYAGYTVATTRAAAEASAFRTELRPR